MNKRNSILAFCLLTLLVSPAYPEMRVGSPDAMKSVVKRIPPEYNPIAKQMRVQGDVEVEARVSEAGDVVDVKVVSGNTLLTASVAKAVKEWKFQPFQENGKPSEAIATLRFTFKL